VYNAVGFIFPVAVGLITTPYIVHKLNTDIYGIYVLAISLMGMLSFLDLGFGQGIIKFVSHYEAKKDLDRINGIINTTLVINLFMGLLGGFGIFSLSGFLTERVFKVKPDYLETAISSFKIVSVGFLINLVSSTFSNIPRALQRYDIAVKIQNIVWFLSITFSVVILYFGYGLFEMLIFHIIFQFLGLISYFYFSKKLIPGLEISLKFNRDVFKEVFGFSIFTAINSITGNIVFRVDKMIISYFLGTSAVTYYQIPFMIAQTANGFLSSVIQFLFPLVSFLSSAGDKEKLKQIYFKSTRYIIVSSLIIFSGLVIFGKPFLTTWIGKNIADISYPLMVIISFVFFFVSVSNVGYFYYNGLGKAKINMISSFVGAFSYLASAFVLIPKFNLKGAAYSFIFILLPFPVYIYILNRMLNFSQVDYLKILSKSFGLILLTLALNYVSYSISIIYILINGLIFILLICFIFVLKIVDLEEIKKIIDRV
jgi:O-antigen/teichoic acid export membrane protein